MKRYPVAIAFILGLFLAGTVYAGHYPIDSVFFISQKDASKLMKAKILDTKQLLMQGKSPRLRRKLARKTGIPVKRLKEYVQMCDLLRIRGIGPKMARIIYLAGVRSVPALAKQDAQSLLKKMQQINKQEQISEILPDKSIVQGWINQAKRLPLLVR